MRFGHDRVMEIVKGKESITYWRATCYIITRKQREPVEPVQTRCGVCEPSWLDSELEDCSVLRGTTTPATKPAFWAYSEDDILCTLKVMDDAIASIWVIPARSRFARSPV
jgi:hypothetical protein